MFHHISADRAGRLRAPLRIECPEALAHVTGRRYARITVVKEDTDRQAFVDLLASVIKRHDRR